jgi:hypothetical protein
MGPASQGRGAKRSLLEASASAEPRPKPRVRKTNLVNDMVQKALRDNFKDFSQGEIDSNLVNGMTLRQRLVADKEANIANKGAVVTGRRYYEALRQAYSNQASPEKMLSAGENGGSVSDTLWQAMVATKKTPVNRAPMMHFLENSTQEPNKSELVGVLRFCLQCQATISTEQQRCIILTMRYVHRLGLAKKYPDEMEIMKPKFNDGLLRATRETLSIIWLGLC